MGFQVVSLVGTHCIDKVAYTRLIQACNTLPALVSSPDLQYGSGDETIPVLEASLEPMFFAYCAMSLHICVLVGRLTFQNNASHFVDTSADSW